MIVRWPDTNQCDATMIEARAYSTSESGFAVSHGCEDLPWSTMVAGLQPVRNRLAIFAPERLSLLKIETKDV